MLVPQRFIVPEFGAGGIEMPTLSLTDEEVDALIEFLLQDR
jgi:hypothetical protein